MSEFLDVFLSILGVAAAFAAFAYGVSIDDPRKSSSWRRENAQKATACVILCATLFGLVAVV